MVNPIKKCEEGSVVVISLAISTVILILLGVFLGSIVAERKRQERSYRSLQALNLAEAGVERAIWELNNNPTPPVSGQIPSITGVGYSEYTVTISGSLSDKGSFKVPEGGTRTISESGKYTSTTTTPLLE